MMNSSFENLSKNNERLNTKESIKMLDYSIIKESKKLIEFIFTCATAPMIAELIVFIIII
ncbi:hypothetical protein Ccar_00130 [Clostridium carboxidivorans P7]|uniref:Uncharacterized protein n=1 Tax=Clostridium carboxidivorans P7 TaxID=536227 RepID=C6PUT8_9CLOT|nr:hypothetical protein [Clostridium carboxidivorans]AKN29323.1 hypothetical protein Ccar_00130 [Clostridium carboxidivorans P7]EET87017.1 hypothetical protein CcarbDRAFT_2555 [Clostridium carboxidivorans P7]EFG89766.1 hypothetical protein CLCAR_0931 [Clostridium carboxidivorans P7]